MDTDPVPHFYQGNLVLVGDAAHPLSPFTSQGVSSALADAVALASAVNAKVKTGRDLTHALAAYSVERRDQCAPYVAKGRQLTHQIPKPHPLIPTFPPLPYSTNCLPFFT